MVSTSQHWPALRRNAAHTGQQCVLWRLREVGGCGGGWRSCSPVVRFLISIPLRKVLRLRASCCRWPTGANGHWPARVRLGASRRCVHLGATARNASARMVRHRSRSLLRLRIRRPVFVGGRLFPGTSVGPIDVEIDTDAVAILFCETTPLNAPVRLAVGGHIAVRISDEGCTLRSTDGG